jgi:hypothetical protein
MMFLFPYVSVNRSYVHQRVSQGNQKMKQFRSFHQARPLSKQGKKGFTPSSRLMSQPRGQALLGLQLHGKVSSFSLPQSTSLPFRYTTGFRRRGVTRWQLPKEKRVGITLRHWFSSAREMYPQSSFPLKENQSTFVKKGRIFSQEELTQTLARAERLNQGGLCLHRTLTKGMKQGKKSKRRKLREERLGGQPRHPFLEEYLRKAHLGLELYSTRKRKQKELVAHPSYPRRSFKLRLRRRQKRYPSLSLLQRVDKALMEGVTFRSSLIQRIIESQSTKRKPWWIGKHSKRLG